VTDKQTNGNTCSNRLNRYRSAA